MWISKHNHNEIKSADLCIDYIRMKWEFDIMPLVKKNQSDNLYRCRLEMFGVEKQFKAKRTANFPTLIPMKISLLIPVLLFTICCLTLRYLKQLKNMKSDWRGEELWRHPRRGEASDVQHNFALFCVRLSESFCACYRRNQGKCCSTINAGKNISL